MMLRAFLAPSLSHFPPASLSSSIMPRRKSVQSLQRLCLENIAENMQCLWARDYTDNYLDEYHFRYIQGPFSELAGSLVQELLKLKGKRLTRPMLHLLLVPHLTELSLRACPKLVSNAITQMVTVRCKNLTSLDLEGCSRIPTDALVDLIEGLPGLTKLDLAETQCNTQVLSAVGSTCQRLRELNISDCKKLSPASLFHLAYDPTAGTFCCPALQILAVDGMESSPCRNDLPCALAYVLLALPSLVSLENEFATDAVCLIHDRQFGSGHVPSGFPSLKDLVQHRFFTSTSEAASRLTLPLRLLLQVNNSSLPVIRAVCPHLAKVTVVLEDSPALPQQFLPWGSLTSLSLGCTERQQLEGLLPITAHLGAQLEFLSLDGFSLEDEMSFHTLLGHCWKLQKFSASLLYSGRHGRGEEASEEDVSLAPHTFPWLHDFNLTFSDLHDSLPSPQARVLRASLVSLLKHARRLRTVTLLGLPFSLDRVFEEILDPPGGTAALLHLTDLSLVKCQVSSGTVHRILSLENPLSQLNLNYCPDIHRKDYDELSRRVGREGLDVRIKWE